MIDFKKIARSIAKISDEKKCENIVILDIRKITTITDFFIIITVNSTTQLEATVEKIQTQLKKYKIPYLNYETSVDKSWTILDYGGVIVHFMFPEVRDYYSLERIWSNAKILKYDKKKSKRRFK